MKRTKPLERTGRLRPVSRKRSRERPAFEAVYAQVDARSGGWCEVEHLFNQPTWTALYNVRHRATERHHLFKPRRSHHTVAEILHVCREAHAEFERPYRLGRRVPTEFDGVHQRYRTAVVYASSKQAARIAQLIREREGA